jgi:hypothetical protein
MARREPMRIHLGRNHLETARTADPAVREARHDVRETNGSRSDALPVPKYPPARSASCPAHDVDRSSPRFRLVEEERRHPSEPTRGERPASDGIPCGTPCESGRWGGAKGNRTPDLFIANEALYQLSYSPVCRLRSVPLDTSGCAGIAGVGDPGQRATGVTLSAASSRSATTASRADAPATGGRRTRTGPGRPARTGTASPPTGWSLRGTGWLRPPAPS